MIQLEKPFDEHLLKALEIYLKKKDQVNKAGDDDDTFALIREQMSAMFDLFETIPASSFYIIGEVKYDDAREAQIAHEEGSSKIIDGSIFFDGKAHLVPGCNQDNNILAGLTFEDMLPYYSEESGDKIIYIRAEVLAELFFKEHSNIAGICFNLGDDEWTLDAEQFASFIEDPASISKKRNEMMVRLDAFMLMRS